MPLHKLKCAISTLLFEPKSPLCEPKLLPSVYPGDTSEIAACSAVACLLILEACAVSEDTEI